MMQKLINVSNRLPVTVTDEKITKSSGGLVAALEGLPTDRFHLQWLGWPGGEIAPQRHAKIAQRLEQESGCTPVFLTAEEEAGHYTGFANSSLWPLLHYMPTRFRYEPWWWDTYCGVNQKFADRVLDTASDGDLVWVHDYQLMLVPRMLKTARPSLRVAFFLHTPFPSYEVFRCHPRREDLVSGLLGADLVGFHTFGYLRHFRSAVLRLLGLESDVMSVRQGGHSTALGVYPIGINAARFEQELDTPALAEQVSHMAANFAGKRIVLSVERLDYTKGLLHRLTAIDLFLSRCDPETRDTIKFVFVSVPSRESVEEYQDLRADLESRIGRLNGKYTTLNNSPIHFIHGSVTFTELCALYALASVALVTPLIDGMNLVAKEYIACQRDGRGVLILSEFAGAVEELYDALIVNPYDAQAVAGCLSQALSMPAEERHARMQGMRQRVMQMDARAWARSFVDDMTSRAAVADEYHHANEARDRIREALAGGQRVGLFLDYDGTLREIEPTPAAARPNEAVRDLLNRLRRRANVGVTIISGRKPADLESFLGEYEEFGFIAEHGATLRRPGSREWERIDRNLSYAWKEEVRRILNLHVDSTPGSFLEDKRTSLVWHYRKADPEFGEWKAKQLTAELGAALANDPVQVRHGKKIVEVTASEVTKGAAVLRLLEDAPYDLALVAGDDTTDESMFRLRRENVLSIKVGEGDSQATFRLPTPDAFRRFLVEAIGEA